MSRQTMIDNHTRSAEHSVVSAKFHKAMEQHFGQLADAMSKAQADGPVEVLQSIGQEHAAMADAHTTNAEYHVQCCKNLSTTHKSMLTDDELAPTQVSIIAPTAPPNANRPVYRAVPRAGAPPAPAAMDAHEDPGLQKLFQVDDES